jgi:hypothetical protein
LIISFYLKNNPLPQRLLGVFFSQFLHNAIDINMPQGKAQLAVFNQRQIDNIVNSSQ